MSIRRQEIEQLWTDGIQVLPGRRPINFDVVDQLAQSMDRIGLRHPITVRALNEINIQLIAGHHRLQAAKKLGWEKIACVVLEADECSEVEAELWEIAENLHRADLSKKQRDEQIRRYAHLIAIRDADLQSGQNDRIESKRADKRGHRLEGVASKTAKETGVSVRTVRRALAVQTSDRSRQEAAAPVVAENPAELDEHGDELAAQSIKWRRQHQRHWERAPQEADREWLYQQVIHWKNSLPPHNADGEILDETQSEPVTVAKDEAVGSDNADDTSAALMAASSNNSDPASLVDVEQGPGAKGGETQPPGPSITSRSPSPDPAPRLPVEGAADTAGVAAPSNLSSDDWANSHEVRSAPDMPDFLKRTAS